MEIASYIFGFLAVVFTAAIAAEAMRGHYLNVLWCAIGLVISAALTLGFQVHNAVRRNSPVPATPAPAPAPARMDFEAITPTLTRKSGDEVAGKPWISAYREVRAMIVNDGDVDFTDVDVVIRPGQPIVAVAEASEIEGTVITWRLPETSTPREGQKRLVPVASTADIRVRCPVLTSKSCIEIVMLAVTFPAREYTAFEAASEALSNPNFALPLSGSGGVVWHARNDYTSNAFSRGQQPISVAIKGQYKANRQETSIDAAMTTAENPSGAVTAILNKQRRAIEKREKEIRRNGPDFQPDDPVGRTRADDPDIVSFSVKNKGESRGTIVSAGMRVFVARSSQSPGWDELSNPEFVSIPVKKDDVTVNPGEPYKVPLTDDVPGQLDRYSYMVVKARIIYRDSNNNIFEAIYRYVKSGNPYGPGISREQATAFYGGIVSVTRIEPDK